MQKIEVPTVMSRCDIVKAKIEASFNLDVIENAATLVDAGELGFLAGIAYANEQLAAQQPVEPWKPVKGMKCVFWDEGCDDSVFRIGVFSHAASNHFYFTGTILGYDHCAALDSIDEIGKPPQYFINRGRCTVAK